MKDFGILIGIAAIIMAIGFCIHLCELDKIDMAKAKTVCVCKEQKNVTLSILMCRKIKFQSFPIYNF